MTIRRITASTTKIGITMAKMRIVALGTGSREPPPPAEVPPGGVVVPGEGEGVADGEGIAEGCVAAEDEGVADGEGVAEGCGAAEDDGGTVTAKNQVKPIR